MTMMIIIVSFPSAGVAAAPRYGLSDLGRRNIHWTLTLTYLTTITQGRTVVLDPLDWRRK